MLAVTDCRITEDQKQTLCRYGHEVVTLPPSDTLPEGVASHPDMLIFILGKKIITSKNYYKSNRRAIDEILTYGQFELVLSSEELGEKYPNDVIFNAAKVGRYLIANTKYTAKEILLLADDNALTVIDIKQGYSKCSICVVSDSAVITSDSGIYKTLLEKTCLDVLKISEGFVDLPPYNYGFIGGATGEDFENVYFCGNLNTHPDGEKIKMFCEKHSKNAVSLSSGTLTDIGTIFFI